jgi:tetratricopeptide (TPR) repeat protein
MKPATQPRFRRWMIIGLLALILLPGAYYLARHQALPAYKSWREQKLARMTKEFMAAGDFDNALLTARQALRKNQRSLTHWKLAAEAAKAKGSQDVVYYQKNVAQLERSLPSQLELLRLSLQFGSYRDALDALENPHPKARDNAEFHRLAAQTYRAVGRATAARLHLDSLISLDPRDQNAQLDLAEIRLAEDSGGADKSAREEIYRLSKVPALRGRTLVLLLKDALSRRDCAGSGARHGVARRIGSDESGEGARALGSECRKHG